MKKSYIEKIVAERFQDEMRLDPDIAALLQGAAAANPYRLAEEIVQMLKKGGRHDKKT